jgi:hypothetical protein
MKWMICLLAVLLVAVMGWLPFEGTDVATLEPAETLYVYIDKEEVCVETDGGWFGKGKSVDAAVADLKESAPGQVFLQTVDYLLLKTGSEKLLPDLNAYLRSGCSVCQTEEKPDLEKASTYLRTHRPKRTLQDYQAGNTELPKLTMQEDRAYLDE